MRWHINNSVAKSASCPIELDMSPHVSKKKKKSWGPNIFDKEPKLLDLDLEEILAVWIGQDWCYIEEIHFNIYKTAVGIFGGQNVRNLSCIFEMIMWWFKIRI